MRRSASPSTNTPVVAPFLRIVVLMTGREHVASLLDCVAGWARHGARVRVAAMTLDPAQGDAGARAAQGFSGRIVLAATADAACEMLGRRGIDADREILEWDEGEGDGQEALARAMRAWQADLAIGAPSNPVALAGSADRSVLVLPEPFAHRCRVPPQRIFVASDGGAASAAAVREAARVAVAGAAIRVGYLACDPAAARHPEDFDAVVLGAGHNGDAASQAIVEAALQWRADLLVLGTHGGGAGLGGGWRFGSVAAEVARRTVVPLLLVPQPSEHTFVVAGNGIH